MRNKVKILHITSDYPDQVSLNKTRAVYNLIHKSTEFEHIVFSLNRVTLPQKNQIECKDKMYVVKYWGFPFGIGLKHFLYFLSKSIQTVIYKQNIKFDIIHAHKLSFEGISAFYMSMKFDKPVVCSIRGDSDIRVLKYKPLYRSLYVKILKRSDKLFFVSPWPKNIIRNMCKTNIEDKSVYLPNIVHRDDSKNEQPKFSNRFVTVFRLDYYKRKNVAGLIKGFDIAAEKIGDIHLDIIGGGKPSSLKRICVIIRRSKNKSNIHILGCIDNAFLCDDLTKYAALVLPSYPETFGMVYLEAILAGIPILHSKNTGVDGYFTNYDFAVRVDHKSVRDIAEGLINLYYKQIGHKSKIIESLKGGELDIFQCESIVREYSNQINRILS